MANNKLISRCKVCGLEYESCASCDGVGWKAHTDTEDHYYILVALMDYKHDRDADAAVRKLHKRGIDVSKTDGYTPSVVALFDELNSAIAPVAHNDIVVELLEDEDEDGFVLLDDGDNLN